MIKSSELGSLPSLEMFHFVLVYVRQRSFFLSRTRLSFFLSRTRLVECHAIWKTVMALYDQEAVA